MADYSDLAYGMAGYGRKASAYDARRRQGYAQLQAGSDTSPILSPWQGVGRLAQALVGGADIAMADRDEKAAEGKRNTQLAAAMDRMKTDPEGGMGDLMKVSPEHAAQYGAQLAMDKIKDKRKRDEDNEAARFLIPPGGQPGQGQATGAPTPLQPGTPPRDWEPHFQTASQTTGLPVDLLKRQAMAESGGNANAVSPAGAGGPMQLMPGTAGDLGVTNRFDPAQAIPKGAQYLKQQFDKYGNLPHALAAYNWGPGNVDNWLKSGGDPSRLPAETQNYIQKIAGGGPQQFAQGGPQGAPLNGGFAPPDVVRNTQVAGPAMQGPQPVTQGDGNNPVQPAQFSPQGGADPGGQYEAAARRAQAAGRGDIAVKYMLEATKAREAASSRDANRTVQHVDLGDVIGVMDSRTGQILQRIPKGQKPGGEGGGAYPGKDIHSAANNILLRGVSDPNVAASPEYASAHAILSQPHQSFDESRGMMVTLPPADLSWAPKPGFRGQQPQAAPQAANGAPPPVGPQDFAQGAPPAPSPAGVNGPTMTAAPPQGPSAAPVPGVLPKYTQEQNVAHTYATRLSTAIPQLEKLLQDPSKIPGWSEQLQAISPYYPEPMVSDRAKEFRRVVKDIMSSTLRRESGASIHADEYTTETQKFIPQPGDSKEVAQNKLTALRAAARSIAEGTGRSPDTYGLNGGPTAGVPQQGSNDGGQPGGIPDGATATNPKTGEKIMRRGGQWVPAQ